MSDEPAPRCSFYVREQVSAEPVQFTYDKLDVAGPGNNGYALLRVPPAVGDLIYLATDRPVAVGSFRVVERAWSYSAFGSMDWPLGELQPTVGPIVDIIVERAVGPFVNEVVRPDEDEEGEDG